MELIEREPLRTKAVECGKLAKQDPRLLVVGLGYVLDAPTIDAVPVVRCGECKHFRNGGCHREHDKYAGWEAEDPTTRTNNAPIYYGFKLTDFCSYGEKREEAPHEH